MNHTEWAKVIQAALEPADGWPDIHGAAGVLAKMAAPDIPEPSEQGLGYLKAVERARIILEVAGAIGPEDLRDNMAAFGDAMLLNEDVHDTAEVAIDGPLVRRLITAISEYQQANPED